MFWTFLGTPLYAFMNFQGLFEICAFCCFCEGLLPDIEAALEEETAPLRPREYEDSQTI